MTSIGHNLPPDMTVTASETMRALSDWMAENPVVESEEKAKEAKLLVDRAKLAVADLEDERKAKVGPLNEQVRSINERYRSPREKLETVIEALSGRLTEFLRQLEQERVETAERAKAAVEQAEKAAREAEDRERDALSAADNGELGVDIAAAVSEADQAFSAYKKTEREARRAEREAENIKISGGFRRSLSLRKSETLVVVDGMKAILQIGITEGIMDAIIKDARAYRKLHGVLPEGIKSIEERKA